MGYIDLGELCGEAYISPDEINDLFEAAQSERDDLVEGVGNAESKLERDDYATELGAWDAANAKQFAELKKLFEELPRDATMIRDTHIDGYLEDEVNSCYDLPKDLPSFVTLTIDYDALKQDYYTVEYLGNTYYVRES